MLRVKLKLGVTSAGRKRVQGKVLRTAKTWSNALKVKGTLVKLVSESGYCYGVISNG